MALNGREICLPEHAVTQLGVEQQKGLLAHELAHIARHDPLWLVASGVIECLFFFQPLARLARRRMQECAEYLCDDQAARYTGGGLALARCLVEVARWPQLRRQPVAVAGVAGSASALERRVRRLLDGLWATQVEAPRWWWAFLLAGVLVVVGCAGPGVSAQKAPAPLVWPVEGRVTQSYSGEHRALDIGAVEGAPVAAAAGGVVAVARWDDVFGNMVILDHGNGLRTFYSKLSGYHVRVGDEVVVGQSIGRVGSTGASTGPHLHFEVRREGERIDPLMLLQD